MTIPACPGCGTAVSRAGATACSKCGLSFEAGLVRRESPGDTRGIQALSRKIRPGWAFAGAGVMAVVAYVFYDDIQTAERTGGSFTADQFTGLMYKVGGKWGVVAFWLAFAVLLILAGLKGRKNRKAAGAAANPPTATGSSNFL